MTRHASRHTSIADKRAWMGRYETSESGSLESQRACACQHQNSRDFLQGLEFHAQVGQHAPEAVSRDRGFPPWQAGERYLCLAEGPHVTLMADRNGRRAEGGHDVADECESGIDTCAFLWNLAASSDTDDGDAQSKRNARAKLCVYVWSGT